MHRRSEALQQGHPVPPRRTSRISPPGTAAHEWRTTGNCRRSGHDKAGIAPRNGPGLIDVAAFEQVFAVNLIGVVRGAAAVAERMASRGKGQIAVNASLAGYRGLPGAAAYGASKAAAIHLCEALRFDCERQGIRLQLVNPGFVDTAMTQRNSFPMPFMVSLEEAAVRVVDGFARDRFEIVFPRRLAWLMKGMRLLPYPAYFWAMRKLAGEHRGGRRDGAV